MDQEHAHIRFKDIESITRLGQRKQNSRVSTAQSYQLVPSFLMSAGGPPSKATSNKITPKYKSHSKGHGGGGDCSSRTGFPE